MRPNTIKIGVERRPVKRVEQTTKICVSYKGVPKQNACEAGAGWTKYQPSLSYFGQNLRLNFPILQGLTNNSSNNNSNNNSHAKLTLQQTTST